MGLLRGHVLIHCTGIMPIGTSLAINEMYGMTENTALSHINVPGERRVGSVGMPTLPGSVRLHGRQGTRAAGHRQPKLTDRNARGHRRHLPAPTTLWARRPSKDTWRAGQHWCGSPGLGGCAGHIS